MNSTPNTHQDSTLEGTEKLHEQEATSNRPGRRQLLHRGLTAAAAAIGAGVLLEQNADNAHAMPMDNVGTFSSSNASVPAVTATGSNGASGVKATSDSGYALYATSGSSGDTLYASNTSAGTGNAIHAWNNSPTASALYAEGHTGFGVYGTSDTNWGVYGWSGTDVGVYASTAGGTALLVNGPMKVQGTSVGQATLLAGKTSVTVTTSAATPSSNILLTPLGNPGGDLWVTRAAGSFTIHSSKAPTASLSIAYLIIN